MHRRHRRRFISGMAMMTSLLIAAIGIIVYQQSDRSESYAIAERLFYQSKSLELELARLKRELRKQPEQPLPASVQQASTRLQAMQERYVSLATEMELIGSHRSKEDLLIFRIARVFGEYNLSIPDSFVSEVKRYIRKWQQSPRLQKAVARINEGDRARTVVNALRSRDLPPQFIYLAVQESNFKTDAIGPKTRFGIAKGMWQFIPQTAQRYGLKVGPEKDKRRYDPYDDRFDFEKATAAAADYLSFLYTTEAQASGLLVMSAYNWGEGNVARIVNRLPDDLSERNFWHLLETQMIPDETYTYVLSIFSAAVIGEDPEHFGFDFDNPLSRL
jgi:membrane-bound lytic murein transglycosylase D